MAYMPDQPYSEASYEGFVCILCGEPAAAGCHYCMTCWDELHEEVAREDADDDEQRQDWSENPYDMDGGPFDDDDGPDPQSLII